MNIIKIARLIEDISYCGHTQNYKLYAIREAMRTGILSDDDAAELIGEYCQPWLCHNPDEYDYTVSYYGKIFEGDVPDDYNEHGFNAGDSQTWDWIRFYGDEGMEITVRSNKYDITYNTITKEWS